MRSHVPLGIDWKNQDKEIVLIGDINYDFSDRTIDSDYNSMHLSNVYDFFLSSNQFRSQLGKICGAELSLIILPLTLSVILVTMES